MKKYEENISERYPIITLIKILAIFNYKSGFIRSWDNKNEKLTIHQIGHTIGLNGREMNQVIKVLEPMGLISEQKSKKKRYLVIEDIVINNIDDSKKIREILMSKNDKNSNQEIKS